MARRDDDFTVATAQVLCSRVNGFCSNPECGVITQGPNYDPIRRTSIGKAAHITAASPGGPRFAPSLTREQRRHPDNGIWLCGNCATLIDSDPERYPVELLNSWKASTEASVRRAIGSRVVHPWIPDTGPGLTGDDPSVLFERISKQLSGQVQARLHEVRRQWLDGDSEAPRLWLQELSADGTVTAIGSSTRSSLLRLEARLALEDQDIDRAKSVAQEASLLAPSPAEDARLVALIEFLTGDREEAVRLTEGFEDLETTNLRTAMLLELGKTEQARGVLYPEMDQHSGDPERLRLRAILACFEGSLADAETYIREALEKEPRRPSIRLAGAVISYMHTVSQAAAVLPGFPRWPPPVDPDLVKVDDESRMRLKAAATTFQDLEAVEREPDGRKVLQTWRLACLLQNPDTVTDGLSFARTLLTADPLHFRVVAWASTWFLEIDLEASVAALEGVASIGVASIDLLVTLMNFYVAKGRLDDARRILQTAVAKYPEHFCGNVLSFWQARLTGTENALESASESVDTTSWLSLEGRSTHILTLQRRAQRSGVWWPLVGYLHESFVETNESIYLLEGCRLRDRLQDWEYIADRAYELVRRVGTATALQLAARGLYRSGRHESVLELLETYKGLFPNGKLNSHLRLIEGASLTSIGRLGKAKIVLEELVSEDDNPENLEGLARIYISIGDVTGFLEVARRLEAAPLIPSQSLQLAAMTSQYDSALGIRFWRRAVERGIPDELVGVAIGLAFQLGIDEDTKPLMARVTTLAASGKSGVRIGRFRDVLSVVERERRRAGEVSRLFERGEVPIHLVSDALNVPLSTYFHSLSRSNADAQDAARRGAIFTRSGSRVVSDAHSVMTGSSRLCLDLTALLLAEEIGLLDTVELALAPVQIHPDTIPALLEMVDRTAHHQPSVAEQHRAVAEYAIEGLLAVEDYGQPRGEWDQLLLGELGPEWLAAYESARRAQGFLVDFLPLTGSNGVFKALPSDAESYLTSPAALIHCLNLSSGDRRRALEAIGVDSEVIPLGARPLSGARIYLGRGVARHISLAGVLKALCEQFTVIVSSRELEDAANESASLLARDESKAWLNRLIQRLNRGLTAGTYEMLQEAPQTRKARDRRRPKGAAAHVLTGLLQRVGQEADLLLWVEDRLVSSFGVIGKTGIVGVLDVLNYLESKGAISKETLYAKLLQLRLSGFLFLPVRADEITHYLMRSVAFDGYLQETYELRILRKYLATCLANGHHLARPSGPMGSPTDSGELPFLIDSNRQIQDAVQEVWLTYTNAKDASIRANWILDSLYVDLQGIRVCAGLPIGDQDDLDFMEIGLASWVLIALEMPKDRQHAYLGWVADKLLQPSFLAEPALTKRVAARIARLCADLVQGQDDRTRSMSGAVFWKTFRHLPPDLLDLLHGEQVFSELLDGVTTRLVTLGEFTFEPSSFFEAISKAVNGEDATLTSRDHGDHFVVCHTGLYGVGFFDSQGVEVAGIADLQPLIEPGTRRERLLLVETDWFDGPETEMKAAVAKLNAIPDGERRLSEAHAWRDTSPSVLYRRLREKVVSSGGFGPTDMSVPIGDRLLKHFRVPVELPTEQLMARLEVSAVELLAELPLEEAIARLTCLPTPLPGAVFTAMNALSVQDRRRLFGVMVRMPNSPTSRLHFMKLLRAFANESPSYARLHRLMVGRLARSGGMQAFRVFQYLLNWVQEQFLVSVTTESWSPETKVIAAWAHASRLFAAITSVTQDLERLATYLRGLGGPLSPRFRAMGRDTTFNIIDAGQLYWGGFMVGGLGYSSVATSDPPVPEEDRADSPNNASFSEPGFMMRNQSLARGGFFSIIGPMYQEAFLRGNGFFYGRDALGAHLDNLVRSAVNDYLAGIDNTLVWQIIETILVDLPPPDDIGVLVNEAIVRTNFVSLAAADLPKGLAALAAASLQSVHLKGPESRLYLRSQLLAVARKLASMTAQQTVPSLSAVDADGTAVKTAIVEMALRISEHPDDSQTTVSFAAGLLIDLLNVWPDLLEDIGPLAHHMVWSLPAKDSRHCWPLVVRVRQLA